MILQKYAIHNRTTSLACKSNLSTRVSHWGITKVAFDDSWLLFGASETMYPIFTGQIKIGLVDRKPLLAGALIHMFDCILRIVQTCTFDRLTACVHSAFEEEALSFQGGSKCTLTMQQLKVGFTRLI